MNYNKYKNYRKKDIYINENLNNWGYWIDSREISFIMTWNYHFLEDNLGFEYSRMRLLESESEIDDLRYILIAIWDLQE